MRMTTKLLSFLLAAVMLFGVVPHVEMEVDAANTVTITSNDVINRANALNGTSYASGMCLGFVADFFAWFGATRSSSCCAYRYGNSFIQSTDINSIPIGADVFFGNCGGNTTESHRQNNGCTASVYGHIGIYIGNGNFLHATGGKVQIGSVNSAYWGPRFRGWGYHGNVQIKGDESCACSESYAGEYICTTSSANLLIRSGHGSGYSSVGAIPKGATVTVTKASGEGAGHWAHVTYNGVSGYSSMEYLTRMATGLDARTPIDVGTDFTALIINVNAWKLIESDVRDSELPHVRINDETGFANQLWHFSRQSDGSYKISSCYDGKYLDVYCALTDPATPIQTCWDTGSDAQKWYIYDENGVYIFRSKLSGQVMDLKNNDSANGNILQTYDWNQSTAQIWAIYRSEDTELKSPELTVSVGDDKTKTTFTWSSVYGARDYVLKVYQNEIWTGELGSHVTNATSGVVLDLPAGTYQAYVDAQHAHAFQMSNVVTFTIGKHACTYTSAETQPTCTSAGSIVYTCTVCGDSYEEILPAKVHTYVPETNSQVSATCETDGWTKYNCIYCDDSYTETIPATGHDYQNNVCTNCGDVLIVEYGVELHVSNAQVSAGGTVTVDIVLDKNVGFTYLNLGLVYDADALELVSVTNGTIVGSLTQGKLYIWSVAEDATATGVLATLTFKVKNGAFAGNYAVTVICTECCNELEQDVAVGITGGTVTVTDFVYGDATGDGEINGKDVTRLLRYLSNYDPMAGGSDMEIALGADVTGDGEINGKDVTRLLRYLADYDPVTGESGIILGK